MSKRKKTKILRSGLSLSKLQLAIFAAVFAAVGGFVIWRAFAATPTELYLSPASQTVTAGQSFSAQIRLQNTDSGTNYNYAKAYLNFPADKLAVTSISASGSNFNQTTQQVYDNNGGTISIIRTSSAFLGQGDYLVATVNFTSKAAGSATVSFNSQSGIFVSFFGFVVQPNLLTGSRSGTYTINSSTPPPAPAPAPAPVPAPKPSPKPSPSAKPAPAPAPAPAPTPSPPSNPQPVINSVLVSDVTYTDAKVSWDTAPATTATFSFGPTKDNLINQITYSQPQLKQETQLQNLQPGTKYYFTITAASGDKTADYQGELDTRGLPVTLFIKSAKGGPLAAKVTVGGVTKSTAGDGSVKFELPAGRATATVKSGSGTKKFQFLVKSAILDSPAAEPKPQTFTFKLSAGFLASAAGKAAAAGAGVLALALGLYGLKRRRAHPRKPAHRNPPAASKKPESKSPPPEVKAEPKPPSPPPPPPNLSSDAPPPHATKYPWVPQLPSVSAKKRTSSIANDESYIEPEDMFEEGKKRLSKEGFIPDPQDPKTKPPA